MSNKTLRRDANGPAKRYEHLTGGVQQLLLGATANHVSIVYILPTFASYSFRMR